MDVMEYGVEAERDLAGLSDMDREWAELAAGRPVTDYEALEFKRAYEDWIATAEDILGH